MTGTSCDGLDAVLVRLEGRGFAVRGTLVRALSRPLGPLGARLREFSAGAVLSAGAAAGLCLEFSRLHADAVRELLAGERADLVCVHGQTVFHRPPVSWQMFSPWPVVVAAGAPVVFDLRGADLAEGGQGAPITPTADWVLFRGPEPRAVVNLGGFCNVSLLPAAALDDAEAGPRGVRGMDVCACNQVLDAAARRALGQAFDEGGGAALRGHADDQARAELAGILAGQAGAGRSLGSGDEAGAWVSRHAVRLGPEDLLRSACAAIAGTIAAALPRGARAILAGGGAHNRCLADLLAERLGEPVRTTADLGVPVGSREAVAFAILGALCQDRVPITLTGVTGSRGGAGAGPVSGCWAYPTS